MKKYALGLVFLLGAASPIQAQSMSPMRGSVTSYTDEFAVRVYPRNPYKHRVRFVVRVYDTDFRPVKARVTPPHMVLGANKSRPVVVVVSFESKRERRVRICTESIPFPGKDMSIKGQVCGRFIARRR